MLTLFLWVFFGIAGMALMLKAASEKTIVITEMRQEQEGYMVNVPQEEYAEDRSLQFRQEKQDAESFRIPLQAGLKAENVIMENRYMDRALWIHIEGAEADFYEENAIYGEIDPVLEGHCETQENGVILKIHMDQVLEYHSTMEGNTLVIAFGKPKEWYGQIVVIDPVGGGSESGIVYGGFSEKDLALQVAKLLHKKTLPPDIRLYFTRMEDMEVTREQRLFLAEALEPDLYIRIGACEDKADKENYGIISFYNENYYIPGFGNVELADTVTRDVTLAVSNRAVGLTGAQEDSILNEIKVPAVQLCMGYMSNPAENELLQQESYQEKLAEGIANAILEIYTGKE